MTVKIAACTFFQVLLCLWLPLQAAEKKAALTLTVALPASAKTGAQVAITFTPQCSEPWTSATITVTPRPVTEVVDSRLTGIANLPDRPVTLKPGTGMTLQLAFGPPGEYLLTARATVDTPRGQLEKSVTCGVVVQDGKVWIAEGGIDAAIAKQIVAEVKASLPGHANTALQLAYRRRLDAVLKARSLKKLERSRPVPPAKFFGREIKGDNDIFCICVAGSMRQELKPEGIALLRRELKSAISGLPPLANFNIICFAFDGDMFKPKNVPATPQMKEEALKFFEGYYGGGSADFRTRTAKFGQAGKDSQGISYVPLEVSSVPQLSGTGGGHRMDLAMFAAFERKPNTVIVVSDWAAGTKRSNDDKPMSGDDICKLIFDGFQTIMGRSSALTVNTISFESDSVEAKAGASFMRKLAAKFGGQHRSVRPNGR